MKKLTELFGELVFDERVMKARLSEQVYKSLKKTIDEGEQLDITVAGAVADAMKEWAVEKGATHYTHWFQPLTGITAEKHDSFISPCKEGGVIMEFSGKELIKGEPDASSFPSGGLRATFEARGYTAWDPTSYAFIKDKTLCIPTAFCSYGGEALDKKTPLLRSMDALNRQALRILRLFGKDDVRYVKACVGPEQEYFLISKEVYEKRKDLVCTGRTLFGARPPKGQEMSDHYFGMIKPKVAEFMEDLNVELWRLGIFAKTEHNEVAPSQHELAPIYTTANIATDHNQLTMEIMQKVAARHGLVCILHEKPFAGVNGSGKHNNWSMSTNTGVNLLDPGKTPAENVQFLLFLTAVIKAVDEYADMMRLSVASAGNDHRLGANEAPPAIISIFLGDELKAIVDSIIKDKFFKKTGKVVMETGAAVIPHFTRDTTDRNRTSPFAFTGNKFEFRSLGSSASVATPNIVLNTAVADALSQFYEKLKNVSKKNFESAVHDLLKETLKKHERVLFNGNGYTDEWVAEAKKRGLYNLKSTPEVLPTLLDKKNIELFTKHGIYTETEIRSRYEILLENYTKTLHIEACTLKEMLYQDFLPAAVTYMKSLTDEILGKKAVSKSISTKAEEKVLAHLSAQYEALVAKAEQLTKDIEKAEGLTDELKKAEFYHDPVFTDMQVIREIADDMETYIPASVLPYPTYSRMLFYV